MEKLSACPICEQEKSQPFMTVKDHFFSGEEFVLEKCVNCGFVFTNPRPDKNDLGGYYESEDYFSHSKKKKGLITFLYDAVKNYSLHKKFKLISKQKKTGSILDIGCATGEFLNHFKNQGWEAIGIEPAEQPRKFAIENYYLDVRPEELISELPNQHFDVITMWHVLEHVPNLKVRMGQIKKLLKPDGLLVIALPNYLSWDAQYYKDFWAGYDVPRHLYHFSPETISLLLEKFDFKIFDKQPLKFDAFYVSLLSEKYESEKLNYIKAFWNGLKSNRAARKSENHYSSLIYLAKNIDEPK